MEYQEHFGKKFYQDKSKGYWISTTCPKVRAHVWVWRCLKFPIPKGCHIHHIDGNKSNNAIENLQIMDRTSHLKLHMMDEGRKQKAREMADKYRPLTKEWHASDEGKAWHSYHAIKNSFGKWEPQTYKCQSCGKDYETTKRSRAYFCSNACRAKARRDSGVDNVVKNCVGCGIEFTSNKYAKNTYCSAGCANRTRNF
jgi:hypothetical protein